MPGRSVILRRLLLDALDLTGTKGPFKFLAQTSLRIFCEHIKNVAAYGDLTRNTLVTHLAMTVPGNDPVISIDYIKRDRQCVEHSFCEFPVLLTGLVDRIIESRFVMGGQIYAHCGHLGCGVYKPG